MSLGDDLPSRHLEPMDGLRPTAWWLSRANRISGTVSFDPWSNIAPVDGWYYVIIEKPSYDCWAYLEALSRRHHDLC